VDGVLERRIKRKKILYDCGSCSTTLDCGLEEAVRVRRYYLLNRYAYIISFGSRKRARVVTGAEPDTEVARPAFYRIIEGSLLEMGLENIVCVDNLKAVEVSS
jgi:hypothetical protein